MMRKKRCSSKKQNAWYLLFCLVLFFYTLNYYLSSFYLVYTAYNLGPGRFSDVFEGSLLCLPRQHLFDKKYNKKVKESEKISTA